MSKEKFVRNKPHCNIGTIGHVDHGKTLQSLKFYLRLVEHKLAVELQLLMIKLIKHLKKKKEV